MFSINEDMSIYVTRGDVAFFGVTADNGGSKYKFQPGDVVRFKVTEKKACENVAFYKDFPVTTETERVEILLTENETKIGEVISKPTDYWYEVELNPYTNPQTILGYDDDGPKVFKLFPEGEDEGEDATLIKPEDIPTVDEELSLTSARPVQNRAITRLLVSMQSFLESLHARFNNLVTLEPGSTTGDAEIADIRVGIDNTIYPRAGDAVREQIRDLTGYVNERVQILDANLATAEDSAQRALESAKNASDSENNAKKSEEAAAKSAEEADRTVRNASQETVDACNTSLEECKAKAEECANTSTECDNTLKACDERLADCDFAYENCVERLEDCEEAVAIINEKTVNTQFSVDIETGQLLYSSPSYVFALTEQGHLEWGYK